MRLIDADKMAKEETEAFFSVQMSGKVDSITQGVNTIVHTKIQNLIADTDTVDVDDLEIVQHLREIAEARGRIIEKCRKSLINVTKERNAAKRVIKDLVIMFGIKNTDPTQTDKSLADQTSDDVVEALIRARF